MAMGLEAGDYGAFMEKFELLPPQSEQQLPLHGLTFAIKDIFDISGRVTGFGNPDWARTHAPAAATSPVVLATLAAGATSVGKTVMDEMAYSINGENAHYGTPTNPCAPDRVPGGSSSGSAVAVAAKLVDFALGTDTGGSVRVPAAYCGIFGLRPSHGLVSTENVTPMSQMFDTVGWFARDLSTFSLVSNVLLPLPADNTTKQPTQFTIPKDCFEILGSLKDQTYQILNASVAKRFGKWVKTVKPNLGPGIRERVYEAVTSEDGPMEDFHALKTEFKSGLSALVKDDRILAIPTVPGSPPKLRMEAGALENFRARAFSLLSIAGLSGFCQLSIPLGVRDGVPVSVSLVARHGADRFLLSVAQELYETLKEETKKAWSSSQPSL
ncbi:unnamed protein product [Urochloa decumbens]|uniref:Amidase domain-containing protein n=1 Tax=Urochloa decumbens TaxID=240449 RepID=A0ABC8ZPW6_9POAL